MNAIAYMRPEDYLAFVESGSTETATVFSVPTPNHTVALAAPSAAPVAQPLSTEQIRDLAESAGLDWQRGYVVDDVSNRYEDFARAILASKGAA